MRRVRAILIVPVGSAAGSHDGFTTMPIDTTTRWRDADTGLRERLIERARAAIERGGVVVFPTETLYGVGARASAATGIASLDEVAGQPERPLTWHAGDVAELWERLAWPTRVHRRLVNTLLPGPVRLDLEQPPEVVASLREWAGVGAGVLDVDGRVAVRVPTHEAAQRVLTGLSAPAVAVGYGTSPPDSGAGFATADNPDLGVVIIDDGAAPDTRPSTTIRLDLSGAFSVTGRGRLTERDVMAALTRTVLFVCTGNTCRSPMAAALAARAIRERPIDGIGTRVLSGGIAAGTGQPATPEAVAAMAANGIELAGHRSAAVSSSAVEEADVIFAMTRSHADQLVRAFPRAAGKTFTLDPDGDVDDPFGAAQDVYIATARRLAELVEARLAELDAGLDRTGPGEAGGPTGDGL